MWLEAAIRHQREKAKSASGSPNSKRQSAQQTKLATLKEAADVSDALATVDINLDVAAGLVVLLGRYKDGELELIQTLQVSDAEFDKLLLRYGRSVNDQ